VTVVDGRTRRGERNREAIIDALIACYDDGILRPSVQEVAERAGVSARSVHNHFVDVEALRAEVAQRQWERFSVYAVPIDETAPVRERAALLVDQRSEVFEGVSPVRRAALLSLPDSPTIAANLAHLDRTLRRQVGRAFPGVSADALDAVDALASWDVWNRLRAAQGVSITRARRILTNSICTLIEGDA
jgi:AcrR family transcriptional regulator